MRKLLLPAILAVALGTTACTDGRGNMDPVATGLLGAGIGAVAGAALVAANQPRQRGWGDGRSDYHRPIHHYDHRYRGWGDHQYRGWGQRPRYW